MKSDAVQRLRDALADALLPAPPLLVSDWARKNFRLSSEYSAATGNFEPYPYQIEPLDVLSPSHPADMMVLMCGAQMMKTLIMMIFLGYVIDVDPGPALIVQPNKEDADSFSKERLTPMISDVPCVAAKTVESKSRDSGNTILQKRFRGGSVSITGAVSPRGLRRRSVRYLFLDEIDGYQETSDGDPVSLAAARTSKFWNRKIVLCSTPTVEGRSRISAAYADSDQRKYFVPCPLCGHMQTLEWASIRWGYVDEGADGKPDQTGRYIAPEDAHYQCAACREFIPHFRKLAMLRGGEWRATNPEGRFPGFGISRLYAPDWSWGKIVADPMEGWLQAKDDVAKVQVFRNNVLAETFREPGEAPPDYEKLMARTIPRDGEQGYRMGQVPVGPLFLNAGVDVQLTWIEGYVWGWGRGKQRWLIDHFRIEKDPFDRTAWDDLSVILNRSYRGPSGADMALVRMAVDTGYANNQVYAFARQHGTSRVLAVDGRAFGMALVAPPSQVDVTIGGRKIKHGAKLWGVNVSMAKAELYGQLQKERPEVGAPFPPGWVHFPVDTPEQFFLQLVSEEFRSEVSNGIRKFRWSPIENRRHEALDCANYARAAAYVFGLDRRGDDDRWWRAMEHGRPAVPEPQPIASPTQPPSQPRAQPPARRPISSNWMRSFLG